MNRDTADMDDIIERALRLWAEPLSDGPAALHAFRQVYVDPVLVNGQATDLQVLVDRARMLQDAFAEIRHDLKEVITTQGRRAFAFTISGRHTGTLASPVGDVPATGRDVVVTGLDIFIVDEATDHVTSIWAVTDWLTLLLQTGTLH